ncbi:hypothetical protein CP03DC29_0766A, partial [Chlamydia psittaci 03DC29]
MVENSRSYLRNILKRREGKPSKKKVF